MGVDVVAISKARAVACQGDEACDETHYGFGSYPKRNDGLKTGCYVVGKGGRSFGFRAGSAAGYNHWRRELSLLAVGVEPEEVWEHPRKFQGQPFVELIDFPDGVGPSIGPKTSAKLHADFVYFASKAKRHFLSPPQRKASTEQPTQAKQKPRKHVQRAGLSAVEEFAEAIGGMVADAEEPVDISWMWEVYRDFRRAFKLASGNGFLSFC